MSRARFNGAREADFFSCQIIQDRAAAFFQFGIERAIRCDHGLRHFGKEGFMQSDLCAKARRASDDHARHIIAPHVARHNAIGDEERSRANMVADYAIRREICEHFFFGVARERAQNVERFGEEIGLVIGIDALQDRDQSLEAHACIDVFGGERIELRGTDAVILDEHQIPNFDKPIGIQNFLGDFFF